MEMSSCTRKCHVPLSNLSLGYDTQMRIDLLSLSLTIVIPFALLILVLIVCHVPARAEDECANAKVNTECATELPALDPVDVFYAATICIQDSNAQTLSDAMLAIERSNQDPWRLEVLARIHSDGCARISNLVAGEYRIGAYKSGVNFDVLQVVLEQNLAITITGVADNSPTFLVTGCVTDPDGRPLRGALMQHDSVDYREPTLTDRNGCYLVAGLTPTSEIESLRPFTPFFYFEPPSYCVTCESIPDDRFGYDFVATLDTSTFITVSGNVIDSDNTPVANVQIAVHSANCSLLSLLPCFTRSDTTGAYSLMVPPYSSSGFAFVKASHERYLFEPKNSFVPLTLNNRAHVNFTATLKPFTITGYIDNVLGVPQEGIDVVLDGVQSVNTGADGDFTFGNLPGGCYRISVPQVDRIRFEGNLENPVCGPDDDDDPTKVQVAFTIFGYELYLPLGIH